jgi:DNA-binding transcriptional LysR family regulator
VQFLKRARELIASHMRAVDAFGSMQRRLIVGISHHIVGADLPLLIRRLNDAEPNLVLELRIASSRETLADFDAGTIDAAVILARDGRRDDARVIFSIPFMWAAARDFTHAAGVPLRLATQSAPCIVRSMAVEALDKASIPWTEVFVGGGITTIGAAVSAGLAVAALCRGVAPPDTIDAAPKFGLPDLPRRDVILYSSVSDPVLRSALSTLVALLKTNAS